MRLPRLARARKQVDIDHSWLPLLAPHLPLVVPVPVARGEPEEGYPWSWSVGPWIAGEVVTDDRLADLDDAAAKLAEFVLALQAIDPTGGPTAGPPNSHRGIPLLWRDEPTRKALDQLHDMIDVDAGDRRMGRGAARIAVDRRSGVVARRPFAVESARER